MMDLDAAWVNAPEPQGSFHIDNGIYIAEITSMQIEESKKGLTMDHWDFRIIGGPFEDKTPRLYHMFEKLENGNVIVNTSGMGWARADQRMCGVNVDHPAYSPSTFYASHTSSVVGIKVWIEIKNTMGNDGRENQGVKIHGKRDELGSAVATDADIQAFLSGSGTPQAAPATTANPGDATAPVATPYEWLPQAK